MEQTPAKSAVYVDNDGEAIDLSVVYGVYKTRQGLYGFFQRCTRYSPGEIDAAVHYIMDNIQPASYDASNARRMMKQIEGSVPKEYQPKVNGYIAAAIIISALHILYMVFGMMYLSGAASSLGEIAGSTFLQPLANSFHGMANVLQTLSMLHTIAFTIGCGLNIIAQATQKHRYAYAAAALYIGSLVVMFGQWLTVGIVIVLTFVGAKRMKETA